jgi:hypothetical protein
VRLDATIPDNPKILELLDMRSGHVSAFVYVCGLAYAGKHGTDGFIPVNALSRIHGKRADADRLVEVGLWVTADKGWVVHGWDEYQQASETTEAVLAKKRTGAAKGNCKRWHGDDCRCWEQKVQTLRAVR